MSKERPVENIRNTAPRRARSAIPAARTLYPGVKGPRTIPATSMPIARGIRRRRNRLPPISAAIRRIAKSRSRSSAAIGHREIPHRR
jgi:hypothetical protein